MKALSIRQPWAWAIATGKKPVENRTWSTSFRGPVLIHAGLRVDREALRDDPWAFAGAELDMPTGGIVGVATIVDCVEWHASPWFTGPFGFVLTDARSLPFVPCKGALGFFDVPPDVAARLRALAAKEG